MKHDDENLPKYPGLPKLSFKGMDDEGFAVYEQEVTPAGVYRLDNGSSTIIVVND